MRKITAKQLAEELLKNPDDIVAISSDNFEMGNATLPLTSINLSRFKGRIQSQSFRDAFDGGSYSADVVKHGGDESFVKL